MKPNKKLRLLHFLWSGAIGGAQRAVYQLVKEQVKNSDLEVAVVFAQPKGYYYKLMKELNCLSYSLNLQSGYDLLKLPRYIKIIRQYDIHHFHSADILGCVASILSGKKRRVYTHRGGYFDYPFKKKMIYKLMGYFLRHFFHAYSGNTHHATVCASKLYKLPVNKFQVTYNGIDFLLLKPNKTKLEIRNELGIKNGTKVVGTSAHLREWKRTDKLLIAKYLLKEKSFKVLIIGDGPDKVRLQQIADKLGISSEIIFIGMKEDFFNYLSVIDIFVLPSMGSESFGNAAVEAMALGIPTIIYDDSPGLKEHIRDGIDGFVVKNDEELVARIDLLLSNEEMRYTIGARGKNAVTSKYTLENMVKGYRQLYTIG